MELRHCISRDKIIPGMGARDRWEALRELLDRVLPARGAAFDSILQSLYDAEEKRCSAVGRSVIVAHTITEEVRGLKAVFGRSRRGIPWDAPDGRTVNLLWLLIHCEKEHDSYLQILSQTVRLCRNDRMRTQLLESDSAEEILKVISQASSPQYSGV